jgi:hypothetical protein
MEWKQRLVRIAEDFESCHVLVLGGVAVGVPSWKLFHLVSTPAAESHLLASSRDELISHRRPSWTLTTVFNERWSSRDEEGDAGLGRNISRLRRLI